ncbi:MAG: hypothetical protein M0P42_16485, partial [Gallionella sp.]|nr:hypothetical protein [Gallionella sp.]
WQEKAQAHACCTNSNNFLPRLHLDIPSVALLITLIVRNFTFAYSRGLSSIRAPRNISSGFFLL